MPSRRFHQKSHHGCVQCKARKVKCDETHPICKNCTRQSRTCEYNSGISFVTNSQPVASQPQSSSAHYGLLDMRPRVDGQPTPPSTSPGDSQIPRGIQSSTKELRLQTMSESVCQDLKLMHHYARSTYLTLTDDPSVEHIWQDNVPREAFHHIFLMHGLLALSALHLSLTTTNDNQDNHDLAIRHYTAALNLYTTALNDVTEENCHALFAFSSLAAIIAFAMSQASSHTECTLMQDTLEIFRMLRGINAVVQVASDWIRQGPLGGLLRPTRVRNISPLDEDVERALKTLDVKCRAATESETDREMYISAIEELRESFNKAAANPMDRAPAVSWPILIPRAYIDALSNNQPTALVILSYYAVLLHELRVCWWAGDRGIKIIEAVSGSLEESWSEVLRWPINKIGLTRDATDQGVL